MSAQPLGPDRAPAPAMSEEQLQQLAIAIATRPAVTGQQILGAVMAANATRSEPLPHTQITTIVKRALLRASRTAEPAPVPAPEPTATSGPQRPPTPADRRWSLPGFDQDWADWWLPTLTHADLTCLVYILRRTAGFQRESDQISLEQFCCGLVTGAGKRLDEGTGLSRATVARALKHLRELGLILAERNTSAHFGTTPTSYRINPQRPRRPYPRLIGETPPIS